MTPEVVVLLINAAGLALAYGVIYPRLIPITMGRMVAADLVLTVFVVGISVALFWGTGTEFWLFGWYVGSFVFALITGMIMEWPLFSWFIKKHDIRF